MAGWQDGRMAGWPVGTQQPAITQLQTKSKCYFCKNKNAILQNSALLFCCTLYNVLTHTAK
jgi:hypothetical protein